MELGEFKEKTTASQKQHKYSSFICQKHLIDPQDFWEITLWTDKVKVERFGTFESHYICNKRTQHFRKRTSYWGNSDRKRSGNPKATTESQDKFLRVNSLHDWWLIGQQLQAQLNSGRSKQVSVSTMKRRLRAAGLTGRVEARKLLLRCQNKTKRLAWAMKHRHY
uniref:Transposase Tc1-like domain-containing protein n=1 Tax=Astatotilapia calliptera TaxID=8154 RepID=A0A3P8QVJ8_ASTCA